MRKFINEMRASLYLGKGQGCLKKGDAENALKYFQKSQEIDGLDENNWIAHHTGLVALSGIAESLVRLDRYEEALEKAMLCRSGCEQLEELGLPVAELSGSVDKIINYCEYRINETSNQTIN